jgi:hypothetical protein
LHTHREKVDLYLRSHDFDFTQQWGPGSVSWDDFVRFKGRESAGFACSYLQPSVLIRFVGTSIEPHDMITPPPMPSDELAGIEFREASMDCM